MNEIVLSFGSNCGDKRMNIVNALEWIETILSDILYSSIYETPEVHGYGPSYCNAVAKGMTKMEYDALNDCLKGFELRGGRTEEMRAQKMVPIDIDIVIWNGAIMRPADFSREFFRIGYTEIQSRKL